MKDKTMCCNTIPRRWLLSIAALGLVLGVGNFVLTHAHAQEKKVDNNVPAALNFTVDSIAGKEVELASYHGEVVLIVNVASKCGLTKQYKQLQELHDEYAEKGLSILGFPANNFGKQEPGSNEQILDFCESNYGVEFDMFAKISVKGDDQAPLYAFLTGEKTNPGFSGDIKWNFEKFLIGRDGKVVARFSPRTKPSDKQVLEAIEAELAKPVPDAVKAE